MSISAYFRLIRLPNCLIAALAVVVGRFLTPGPLAFDVPHLSMAAAFFVCAFGNILNDIVDRKSDAVNHPDRPLPSGRISVGGAGSLAVLFVLVAAILMVWLNGTERLLVLLALALVAWYDFRLKHVAYLGNTVVALLGALAFLLGAAASGPAAVVAWPGASIAAAFALLMHFGREIIKDIQDRSGDSLAGSRTAPIIQGSARPLLMSHAVFAALIALSVYVYLQGWFNETYFYITMIFINIPLVFQTVWLGLRPTPSRCRIVALLVKIEMLPGLAALVLGRHY